MSIAHDLIEGWQTCNLESPPYLFPGDSLEMLKGFTCDYHDFDEYVTSRDFGQAPTRLHTGLLPVPYVGNLAGASIYILMLNPGFSPGDYFAEQYNPEFKQAITHNLRQENGNETYPFIFLNPRFAWHPGFGYWHKRFRPIIQALAGQRGESYQQAMSQVAQSVACLELLPYHSKSFGAGKLLAKKLPSVEAMRSFVHDVVVPKANDDKATVIVTRSARKWGLPESKNILVYKGVQARSAHLTQQSQEKIKERLGLIRTSS
jgi:hypothetical protein